MAATIKGQSAVVRWSYYEAAALGPWMISADKDATTLTATVVSADEFRCAQTPLTFVVPRPSGLDWLWPIQSLAMGSGSLTATLGEQE